MLPRRVLVVLVLAAIVACVFLTSAAVETYASPAKKTTKPVKKTTKPVKKTTKPVKKTTKPVKKTTKPVKKTNPPVKKTNPPVKKTNPPTTPTSPPTRPTGPANPPLTATPPFTPTYAPVPTAAPTQPPETSIPRPHGCPTWPPEYNNMDMEFDCALKPRGATDKPRHMRSEKQCEFVAYEFGRDSATFTFTKVGVDQRAGAFWMGSDKKKRDPTPFTVETGRGAPGSPDFLKITVPYNPPDPDPEQDLYYVSLETTPERVSSMNPIRIGYYNFYPWASNPGRDLKLVPW